MSEAISEPAAGNEAGCVGQGAQRDHQLDLALCRVQIDFDRGYGDVHDERVENRHEGGREQHEECRERGAGGGDISRRLGDFDGLERHRESPPRAGGVDAEDGLADGFVGDCIRGWVIRNTTRVAEES